RFTTAELAKALSTSPLEMFLYFMAEQRDLFAEQLVANDSQKRILLYVQVLATLSQLELGGFDEQLLTGFAQQTVLLQHAKHFAQKLFGPAAAKGNLDAEALLMLRNIKCLLIRAHKLGVLGASGYELIEHFKRLLARCQLPKLLEHPLCIEFTQELQNLPIASNVKHEIYPKLEQLLQSEADTSALPAAPATGDVAGYINWQRRLLCEDFVQPLRQLVQRLRDKVDIERLKEAHLLWPHTQLILNPEFAEAERNSLIFLDCCPAERLEDAESVVPPEQLEQLKTGTLLCLTTSYDFDNLILAIVGYTKPSTRTEGYLSVEIAKQYNIGNIYGQPLIMFEAPVFFEPYLRVHNYLSTCSADSFPMRRYIVDGQVHVRPPAFIGPDTGLRYNQKAFPIDKCPAEASLNARQKLAFSAALTNEFCLIQGPPGTGKTHLSVQLVNTLLQNVDRLNSGPIILLTYTNDSLDKFLLQLSAHTDNILRFGCQTRLKEIAKYNVRTMVDDVLVPPRLKRIWWLVSCEYKEQFQRLQALHADFDGSEADYVKIQAAQEQLQQINEKINTLRTIFQYYVAKDRALLAMTTTCAARLNFLFRLLRSKCFVFEEAGETAETHVLACLTPHTEHVILIGDHKQLQPHTGTHTLQGLQVSLFERLITTPGFPATVLNVQYRMRSCIAELLVPHFYDQLISDRSVDLPPKLKGMSSSLYFVNHNQPESQLSDMSYANVYEAKTLIKLLEKLLKLKCKDIVILSPYTAQVEYIRAALGKAQRKQVSVSTVDSFQGLEAQIVLLSLVRSNPSGQIGFLRQPNRVCVALSRARTALYMIGNMETLQRGNPQLWGAISAKLQAQNAIGEQF
ncbi:hypothetical protein KR222_006367, partial [Zaprionus bogoriensis]